MSAAGGIRGLTRPDVPSFLLIENRFTHNIRECAVADVLVNEVNVPLVVGGVV